ncbi:MAG: RHS repeat-associated core domain-containing protein, partial [Anaerolineae bacterium]|nr:RHS repeat-associated core domain-containing protein [Anaerolineae bacterium]
GLQGYAPYGEPLVPLGPPLAPWGYTGEWEDPTGLVYLRARWYSPALGRFVSADRAPARTAEPETWHQFAYASSNPLRYIDPLGLWKVIILYGGGYGTRTGSFRAAAFSLKQTYLARGYAEQDIKLQMVTTDAEVLKYIRLSGRNEIERLAIFSHGYPGGLQLTTGTREEVFKQFECADIDASLRDRFAPGAHVSLIACMVGRGDLANADLGQQLADAWGVTVTAPTYYTKFWYAARVWSLPPVLGRPSASEFARSVATRILPLGPVGLVLRARMWPPTVEVDVLWPYEGGKGYRDDEAYVYQLPYEGSNIRTRMYPYAGLRRFIPVH